MCWTPPVLKRSFDRSWMCHRHFDIFCTPSQEVTDTLTNSYLRSERSNWNMPIKDFILLHTCFIASFSRESWNSCQSKVGLQKRGDYHGALTGLTKILTMLLGCRYNHRYWNKHNSTCWSEKQVLFSMFYSRIKNAKEHNCFRQRSARSQPMESSLSDPMISPKCNRRKCNILELVIIGYLIWLLLCYR